MIVVELDARTAAHIRLAVSPAAEIVGVLRRSVAGQRDVVFGDVDAPARRLLGHPDVALVATLLPTSGSGYLPDFLTPKPPIDGDPLAGQLDKVASTPAADVHQHVIVERFGGRSIPAAVAAAASDGSLARRAALGLHLVWRAVLRERWAELRRVLDADIARRLNSLGRLGAAATIAALHPDIAFDGRLLRIQMPPWDERGRLEDTEVVLAPTLFGPGRVSPQLCRADEAVITYPALSGRAEDRGGARAVEALIGTTRSALLAELAVPRSTSVLSERLHLSPATVSYHLGILHDSGLVLRRRDRHTVLYERSARAGLLFSPAESWR